MNKYSDFITRALGFLSLSLLFFSCSKILDVNPETGMTVSAKHFKDFKELINSKQFMISNLDIGNMMTDDVLLFEYSTYSNDLNFYQKPAYYFKDEFWQTASVDELYESLYRFISQCNMIIKEVPNLSEGTEEERDGLIAQAKIHRAYFYFQLVNLYGRNYNQLTASSDLAVPLVLNLDPNQLPNRASVADIYSCIEHDLTDAYATEALPMLSANIQYPGRIVAAALLAKVHLQKGEFENAETYAKAAVEENTNLIDYAFLDSTKVTFPSSLLLLGNQPELIFPKVAEDGIIPNYAGNLQLSKELSALFEPNDLRVKNFYTNMGTYKVYKTANTSSGRVARYRNSIGVPEMMLIIAECEARKGSMASAMNRVNAIRAKRFYSKDFKKLSASTASEALKHVLDERRRELVCVGSTRLFDLKRLAIVNGKPDTIKRWHDNGTLAQKIPTNSDKLIIPLTPKVLTFNPNL